MSVAAVDIHRGDPEFGYRFTAPRSGASGCLPYSIEPRSDPWVG